jgi:hypothetical protein
MCIRHTTEEYRRFPIPRKPHTPPSHQKSKKKKKSGKKQEIKNEASSQARRQDVTQGRRGAAGKPCSAIGQFDSVAQVG